MNSKIALFTYQYFSHVIILYTLLFITSCWFLPVIIFTCHYFLHVNISYMLIFLIRYSFLKVIT